MIDDVIVKAIIEISNNDNVIKMVEPNLMWHQKIEVWMVSRVFKAIELLQEEYELRGINTEGTGTLPSQE